MKPIPFVDHSGETIAWVSREQQTLHDANGSHFAWIVCNGVFAQSGQQIGYWFGNMIRDLNGLVLLVMPSANIEHMGAVALKDFPQAELDKESWAWLIVSTSKTWSAQKRHGKLCGTRIELSCG